MARTVKKAAQAEGFQTGIVESWEVKNVKSFDWGITFTLTLNGVEIHGVKVGEKNDGTSFIAMPSYKGKDGKWYSHVFFHFSEEDHRGAL